MITIRSSKDLSEPSLICFEATVTTPRGVFTMSSDGPLVDATSPFGGGLFGAMSWPRSRFQLTPEISLEHQMFLPHDGSAAALSWELHGGVIPAQLVIRPYFSGCGPRTYRDVGFRFESQENGGRLTWLPHVRGPRIIADTNGRYYDEPSPSLENSAPDCAEFDGLATPGSFEFHLTNRPSVIIFSSEGKTHRNQFVGTFLAGLMQNDRVSKSDFVCRGARMERANHVVTVA